MIKLPSGNKIHEFSRLWHLPTLFDRNWNELEFLLFLFGPMFYFYEIESTIKRAENLLNWKYHLYFWIVKRVDFS